MLTQLNTSLASCNYTYVVTFDRLTAKYTFTVSGATGNPQFDFSNNNLGRILGFNKSVYTFSGGILNSANVVNFQLTSTVQLMCSLAERSLLATIIPDVSDLSIILYNEQNTQYVSKNVSSVNISSVRFWLLDATSSEELDLNGLEFTFKFVIYKENPYYRVMLNLLKIENAKKELEQKQ